MVLSAKYCMGIGSRVAASLEKHSFGIQAYQKT
jgi:hypothetical protein